MNEAVHNFPQLIYTDEIRIYITAGINLNIIINELYVYESQLLSVKNYNDSNMSNGSYRYQVRAIDRAGNWGDLSDIVTVQVGSYPSPENLSASVENNQVSLEWTISDPKNVNGYYVYRDNHLITRNLTKEYSVVVSSNDNYSQYLTDGDDSTYWYGYDDSFIELSSIDNNDIDKIVLQWFAVPTKNYKILAWINDSWQTIREINNNTSLVNEILLEKPLTTNKLRIEITYEDRTISLGEIIICNSLIPRSNYTETVLETGYHLYYVQAVFTDGVLSAFSNQVNVHIDDSVSPATPTNFIVTEEKNSLKLEWSPNQETDLAGYFLYFGETKLQLNEKILSRNTINYSYQPRGFKECTFELVAVDINENQSLPAIANFSFNRPLPPTDVKANVYKDRLSISFNPSSKNIIGYKLYKNGVPINFVSINPSTVKASSIYYGNNRYSPQSIIDGYTNTFWKPHYNDNAPCVEFIYSNVQFISAFEINWLSSNEVPDEFVIEAWIDQEWKSIGVGSKEQKQLFDLQDSINTDKLRIRVNKFSNSPCLAEVAFYYFCRSFDEINLLPGQYRYQVAAINAAGLQSPKSEEAHVIISEEDLEVTYDELFIYPSKPHFQSPTVFRANIKNIGTQISRNIKVRFYLDSQDTILYETLINFIAPGKDALIEARLNLTQTGSHTLIVKVDPENEIIEFNENNNEVMKALEISDQKVIETQIRQIDATNFPEVLVDLAINDEFGQALTNLTANSFTVMEDNIKQNINSVKYLPNDPTIIPKVDIIFVLDVTGSMSDDYAMVYDSIYTFLNLLEKQNIDYNLGLTLFGDGVYIQQNGQLTNSGDTFRNWMENPTGGDWGSDFPENSVGALQESISKMNFRDGTKKAFILVTDAPSWNTEVAETIQQVNEINGSIYVVGPTPDNLRDIYDGNCPSDWEHQYMGDGSLSVETGGKFYPITRGFSSLVYDLANEIAQKGFNYQIAFNTLNYMSKFQISKT